MDFSLVAASRSYSQVGMSRILIVVASLVAEHGLQDTHISVVAASRL